MSKEAVGFSNGFEKSRTVVKVGSPAELHRALERGAKAAVLQFPEQKFPFCKLSLFGQSLALSAHVSKTRDALVKYRPNTAVKKIQKIRNELCQHIESLHSDADTKKAMIIIFDTMAKDLVMLRDSLPQYTLDKVGILLVPNELITPWHRDNEKETSGVTGLLRYVRTIQGPSTELALDKVGSGAVKLPNGAGVILTTGPTGAWHRCPPPDDWAEHRIAFAVWLKPT